MGTFPQNFYFVFNFSNIYFFLSNFRMSFAEHLFKFVHDSMFCKNILIFIVCVLVILLLAGYTKYSLKLSNKYEK